MPGVLRESTPAERSAGVLFRLIFLYALSVFGAVAGSGGGTSAASAAGDALLFIFDHVDHDGGDNGYQGAGDQDIGDVV